MVPKLEFAMTKEGGRGSGTERGFVDWKESASIHRWGWHGKWHRKWIRDTPTATGWDETGSGPPGFDPYNQLILFALNKFFVG